MVNSFTRQSGAGNYVGGRPHMAHDAEDYGCIAGAKRVLLARHDEKEEAELYPLAQAR
jgi:hypothetical protein